MKKPLLLTFILFSCLKIFSQSTFLAFDFADIYGDESSVNATTVTSSIQEPVTITRGPGLTARTGSGRFNSSSWTSGTEIDPDDYLEIIITPADGYNVILSDIVISSQRSSKGPKSFVVRTSIDGFAADASNVVSNSSTSTVTSVFTLSNPINTTDPFTIRIYGYDAEAGNGTWGPGSHAGDDILFQGPGNIIVPLRLGDIRAYEKAGGNQLEWSSYDEQDLRNFEVQRSVNGINFVTMGVVPAKNRTGRQEYLWYDASPAAGKNLYRIKCNNANGKFIYSPVMLVDNSQSNSRFYIYPNPLIGRRLTFQANKLQEGIYTLELFSANGAVIYCETFAAAGRSLTRSLQLPDNITAGLYYFVLKGNAVRTLKKLVVQ